MQKELQAVRAKVAEAEAQLAALEATKKAAAKARDFKQAGAVSKDAKRTAADLEALKAELHDLESERCDSVVPRHLWPSYFTAQWFAEANEVFRATPVSFRRDLATLEERTIREHRGRHRRLEQLSLIE